MGSVVKTTILMIKSTSGLKTDINARDARPTAHFEIWYTSTSRCISF